MTITETPNLEDLADRVGGLEDHLERGRARRRLVLAAKLGTGVLAGALALVALAGDGGNERPAELRLSGVDAEETTTLEEAEPATPATALEEPLSASSREDDAVPPSPAEAATEPQGAPSGDVVEEPSAPAPTPVAEATTTTGPPPAPPTTQHPSATTTVPPAPAP